MEEKLRPGVFSSYTAGSSGYGSGSRAAGLIVPGVTAPGTPVWVTDGTEAASALPAPEEAATLAACELLLATGAGKVWLCPVAEEGWQAAFDLAGAEAELDTIVCACEEEADALAFAAMLTAAANDRRERVGIIAAADDEAALALAAAVNCERVMLTAGSGIYQDCDSPLCLAAAAAGWGGLSVLCQTLAVLEGSGLRLRNCLLGKVVQSAFSLLLAALLAGYVLG